MIRIGFALALGASVLACSSDPDPVSPTPATGSSAGVGGTGGGGGGGGGAGGVASFEVCVKSPTAAQMPGDDDCPAPMPGRADAFDDALAAGGLDRCGVRLLPEDVALSGWPDAMLVDKHRLPVFTPLQRGPLRLPGFGRETSTWLDAAIGSDAPVSGTVAALAERRGSPVDGCWDLTPFLGEEGDTTPLATAVLRLLADQGGAGDEASLRAALAGVPLDLQTRLAKVVGAIDLAAVEVKGALGTSSAIDLKYLARSPGLYVPGMSIGFKLDAASIAKLEAVDVGRIAAASALLARTIEEADLGSVADAEFAPFETDTPIGRIVIHGSGVDEYLDGGSGEDAALLFDLGGDDAYEVPTGASNDLVPVAIAIDVRGVDSYGYAAVADPLDGDLLPSDTEGRYDSGNPPTEDYGPITLSRTGRQGAGDAGIGMLFDLGPEGDTYRSLAASQGSAGVGVGLLYDAGGDDRYEAEVGSQGFATFGIGALVDAGGKDVYRSFSLSQGFGGALGAGAVIDRSGDDEYYCDPGNPAVGGHPLYFSPQLPGTGNGSMSQGAAQGRRPLDATDAAYMAGGLGVLRDLGGRDHYTGSVFAQGVGYWQGIGMLLDGGSDPDTYDAYWYIQGSTAHFALSLFLEEGGDDEYNLVLQPAATSIGVGHDFSASLHIDLGGSDQYRAPGLSLGSGNINGIGCLVNVGGDDTYTIAGDPTLGAGNYSSEAPFGEPRQDAPTIGIFVDAGGKDTYVVAGLPRPLDDSTWSYEPQPYPRPQVVTTEHGCGADDVAGTVELP